MKMLFTCASLIHKKFWFLFVLMVSLLGGIQSLADVHLELTLIDATHYNLALDFDIDEYDGIYEQYLSISIDDPNIVLSKLECSIEPTIQYAPAFKSSKSLFFGPCSFSGTIEVPSAHYLETAHVYATYRLFSQKHSETVVLALSPQADRAPLVPTPTESINLNKAIDVPQSIAQQPAKKKLPISQSLRPAQEEAVPLIPLGILSILCAFLGIFLIFKGSYWKRKRWRPFAASLGMALIACSIVVAAKAYQALYTENRERLISIKK